MNQTFYISSFLIMGLFLSSCENTKIISPIKTIVAHQDYVWSVAFDPTGKLVASCAKEIKLWDVQSGKCIATFGDIPKDLYYSIAFSPDGKILASGDIFGKVKLWDVDSQQCVATLSGHDEQVYSLNFAKSGKLLATGSWDGTVRLWDAETNECVKKLESPGNSIMSVAFVPGTNLIISAVSREKHPLGVLKVWDIESGELLKTINNDVGDIMYSVAVSPNGKFAASGVVGGDVYIWNLPDFKLFAKLKGHSAYASAVTFSPDGEFLASPGLDWVPRNPSSNVRLWDIKRKTCVSILKSNNSKKILTIAFSKDGKLIASGGMDEMINIWEIK